MRTARVRRQRSIAQRSLLVIIAALTAVISGVAGGLAGYLVASTDAGLRSTLAAAPAADAAYQVSARAAQSQGRSDAAVRERVAALLPGVAHVLHRSVVTGPRSIVPPSDEDDADPATRAVLSAYPDLAEHADLVAGRWPAEAGRSDALPIAIHAGAAAGLGLRVGDEFDVADRGETVGFVITGLWAPREPDSAYWGATPLEIEGTTEHVAVLAVAREADLAAVPGFQLSSRWRLDLDLAELTAADLAVLRQALPRLPAELATDPRLAGAEIAVDGGLATAVQDSHRQVQAARAVTAVPLVLLGLVSIITIALVAHLLVIRREPESALLRTRGATRGLLARWALGEALLVAVVPAALGGAAAWLVLELLGLGAPVSPYPVATGAAVTGLLVVATMLATTSRGTSGAGRAPIVLRVAAVIVLSAAVAVLGWQLRRAGTPFLTVLDGPLPIDPVAAALPALALLAGGLLGAVAVPAVARAGQRLAARQRGLTGPLAVREVARRPMAYALPVTLVVIAVGVTTLAAGFAATWSDLQERTAAQRTGADLQVSLGDRPATVSDGTAVVNLQPYRTVSGVEHVTPVLSVPLASPQSAVQLIARPADDAEPLPGIDLPAASRSVSIELTAESLVTLPDEALAALDIEPDDAGDPASGLVHLDLWLVDGAGQVSTVSSEPIDLPVDAAVDVLTTEHTVTVALPGGSGSWRVVAIDLRLDTDDAALETPWRYDYTVAVAAIRDAATGSYARLGAAGRWASVQTGPAEIGDESMVEATPVRIGARTSLDGEPWAGPLTVRLLPATLATMGTVEPLPVAASEAVLATHGLAVGDETIIRWSGGDVPVLIDDAADVLAGASVGQVMAADLTRLTAIQLSTSRPVPAVNQLWFELGPPSIPDAMPASTVARLAGPDSVVLDRAAMAAALSNNTFAGQGQVAFWATSGVAIVLAAAGLAAGAAAVTRRRAVEVAMLRSVGLSASQQSRSRRREQVLVGMSAIVLGAGAGWLITDLLAGRLAGTVTSGPTESLHPVTEISLGPWLGLVGVAVVAGLAVAIVHGSWVRRQALAATTPQHRLWWGEMR